MTTTDLKPGLNLPSLRPHATLFREHITANADGSLRTAVDPEVLGDAYGFEVEGGHVALVPSFTTRGAEVGFVAVPAGWTVRAYATADNQVAIETDLGTITFTDQPVVVYNATLDADVVKAWYAAE